MATQQEKDYLLKVHQKSEADAIAIKAHAESIEATLDDFKKKVDAITVSTPVDRPDAIIVPQKKNGFCTHFGQSGNRDYTEDKIQYCIDLNRRTGFTWFRDDVTLNDDGTPKNAVFEKFYKAVNEAGMHLMVVIYIRGRGMKPANGVSYTKAELEGMEQRNYIAANNFAKAHPNVTYYQLANELDVFAKDTLMNNYINNPNGDSLDRSKYNLLEYPAYMAGLTGLYEGIRAAVPTAKLGMNKSWVHDGLLYFFATDLAKAGLKLDFMGLDLYNDQEYNNYRGLPAFGRMVPLLKWFWTGLVEEMIITEVGYYGDRGNAKNVTQPEFIKAILPELEQADGYFYYEALDEILTRAGTIEATMGVKDETVEVLRGRG